MKRNAKRLGAALSVALLAALCAALLLFAGCKDLFHPEGPEEEDVSYTVTFDADGGTLSTQTRTVKSGGSVGSSMPDDPSRNDGYAFDGWYTQQNGGGSRFTGSSPITSDLRVYAKWTPPVSYELTENAGSNNYSVIPDNFLPEGFFVNEEDRIEVSFLIKTDANITGFAIGIADWDNGGDWIATNWGDVRSIAADGRFHRVSWTLTAQGAGPVGASPLMIQFSIDSVNKPKVTVYVSDVNITKTSLPLVESLARIRDSAVEGGSYAVSINADETIAPQTLSYDGKNVSVTLVGGVSEQTIRLSGTGALFTVERGVTLTLGNNVTLAGRSDNTDSLIYVDAGGELVMNAGSKISGNRKETDGFGYGGGVYVGGTLTMNGGTISGNTAYYGGGVYVCFYGTFAMNGGTISDNSSSFGGGVNIDGRFTMSGGSISGNRSGGGVYVSSNGSFAMIHGEISGNFSAYGGGVRVSGTFTMSGGTISGNTASNSGGGVNVDRGTFTKESGGVIYGSNGGGLKNTAANGDSYGHAVYVDSSGRSYIRNTTAGTGVTLDSRVSGSAGGWE